MYCSTMQKARLHYHQGKVRQLSIIYQCRASTDQGAIDYSVAPKTRMCPSLSVPAKVITIQAKENHEFLHYDEARDMYYRIVKR